MGERFVVTVRRGESKLCALHYHWGAYPYDSVMILDEIVQELAKMNYEKATDMEIQLAMIRFAERTGGGISGGKRNPEWGHVKKMFPKVKFKADGINGSKGLIAISPSGIGNLNNWAEGVADIELYAQEITNWVVEERSICNLKTDPLPLSVNPASYSMDESATLAKEVSPARMNYTCFRYGEYTFVF